MSTQTLVYTRSLASNSKKLHAVYSTENIIDAKRLEAIKRIVARLEAKQ